MPDLPWKPDEEAKGRAKKRLERQRKRAEKRFEDMRGKVVQGLTDLWKPYHGSTAHREDADGNQMVEKKKSGGHMPLNAAVMALWEPKDERATKLLTGRELLARELYRLACGTPLEVVQFSEIQSVFRDYGAGDSDYPALKRKAAEGRIGSRTKLLAVDLGIDNITDGLIAQGVSTKDFWVDFGYEGVPTKRDMAADEKKKERYLAYQDARRKLLAETKPDGSPKHKRVTNKAVKLAAKECGCAVATVERAIQEMESGYIREEAS